MERERDVKKEGLFTRAESWLNKLSRNQFDSVHTEKRDEKFLPSQLRSMEVKSSNHQWTLDQYARQTTNNKLSRNAGNIATGNVNDWEYVEDDSPSSSKLEYAFASIERTIAPGSSFTSAGSTLAHLNTLLERNTDTFYNLDTKGLQNEDSISEQGVNATMAFTIEITTHSAEITLSVGSTYPENNRHVTQILTDPDNDSKIIEEPSSSEEVNVALFVPPSIISVQGAGPPVLLAEMPACDRSPLLDSHNFPIAYPSDNTLQFESINIPPTPLQEDMMILGTVPIHQSHTEHVQLTVLPNSNSNLPNNTTSATDLSYIALFCFGMGILCTYLLTRLFGAVATWYRTRTPRYIAALEKQAIALLSGRKYAQVKALLERALPVVESQVGRRHSDVAAFRHFLAKALLGLGEQQAAASHLRGVVAIYETYGEDLYMAHALEDLALAQQAPSSSNGDNAIVAECEESSDENTKALATMQRALRIFTEEALAAQAIQQQKKQESEGCGEEGNSPDLDGSVCTASSTVSETTFDSASSANSIDSERSLSCMSGRTTPGVFTIRSATASRSVRGGTGSHGSALWDRELLTSASDEEIEADEVSSDEDAPTTHSLDSQDPHSPIYDPARQRARSPLKVSRTVADDSHNGFSRESGVVENRSRQLPSPARSALSVASPTKAATAPASQRRAAVKKVDKSSGSCGGSPDNENTNPNNSCKPNVRLAGRAQDNQAPIIHGHNHRTMSNTPHSSAPPPATASQCCTPPEESAEVSLTAALADLERLLAQPAASPNTLLGPSPLSPESLVLDYSLEYETHAHYLANNMSTSGFDDAYTDVYDQLDSEVKATANPLHSDASIETAQKVVNDLNESIFLTPGREKLSTEGVFGPIECVQDLHVGRVLHRVACLLGRLHRHAECVEYLTAARTVYCKLHGSGSEDVCRIAAEITRVRDLLDSPVRAAQTNEVSSYELNISSVYSVHSPHSVGSNDSGEVFTPLTSTPLQCRARRRSKK